MRRSGLLQLVASVDGDLDLARAHRLHQPRRHFAQPRLVGDIGEQSRTLRVKRALLRQQGDIERVDRAGRRAEADERAERPQAIQRAGEGRLADAVIDRRAQLAAGNLLDPGDEILAAVEDGFVGAGFAREPGLVLAAHGADHGRAEQPRPLAQDEADAARRRMDEDRVARLYRIGPEQQIFGGEALEHHRRRRLVGDVLRQRARRISPRYCARRHRRPADPHRRRGRRP